MATVLSERTDAGSGSDRGLMGTLGELAGSLHQAARIDDLLRVFARHLCDALGPARCSVFLTDSRNEVLRARVVEPGTVADAGIRGLTLPIAGESALVHALTVGRPTSLAPDRAEIRRLRAAVGWGRGPVLGVPLAVDKSAIGMAFLDTLAVGRRYSVAEEAFVGAAAAVAAAAVVQHGRLVKLRQSRNSATRRLDAAETDAAELLVRELVRDRADVGALARHGVDLSATHVLCLLSQRGQGASAIDVADVRTGLRAVAPAGGHAVASVEDWVVVVLEVCSASTAHGQVRIAKASMNDLIGHLDLGSIDVTVSTVCREPADYPAAFAQAREVDLSLTRTRAEGRRRVIAVDDLGPARLFLRESGRRSASRFTREVLGPLAGLDSGAPGDEILTTAREFMRSAGSARATAATLGVHENTVRYRLRRLRSQTGLDVVGNTEDQAVAALALLMLRVQEELPAPA